MTEENGNGAAAKAERRILADVALWLIPILLVGIFGFVWSINSKVTDLQAMGHELCHWFGLPVDSYLE